MLHRPVTQRVVYTKSSLHRADFTHLNSKLCADQLCKKTSFYNDIFLHRFPLTQGNSYTRDPLHRAAFDSFCTEQFLHGTFFVFNTWALTRFFLSPRAGFVLRHVSQPIETRASLSYVIKGLMVEETNCFKTDSPLAQISWKRLKFSW